RNERSSLHLGDQRATPRSGYSREGGGDPGRAIAVSAAPDSDRGCRTRDVAGGARQGNRVGYPAPARNRRGGWIVFDTLLDAVRASGCVLAGEGPEGRTCRMRIVA